MKSIGLALLTLILGFPTYSWADPQTETGKAVGIVAVNETVAGVSVTTPGDSANCTFGIMTFDPTTSTGVLLYASLLSAKSTNRTVTIYYDRVGGKCTVTQVTVL